MKIKLIIASLALASIALAYMPPAGSFTLTDAFLTPGDSVTFYGNGADNYTGTNTGYFTLNLDANYFYYAPATTGNSNAWQFVGSLVWDGTNVFGSLQYTTADTNTPSDYQSFTLTNFVVGTNLFTIHVLNTNLFAVTGFSAVLSNQPTNTIVGVAPHFVPAPPILSLVFLTNAPTVDQIGGVNIVKLWFSNDTAGWLTYYDSGTNAHSTNVFSPF